MVYIWKMKKRNVEKELVVLENIIKSNEIITQKIRNSILKQIEVIKKCSKPKHVREGQTQNSGLSMAVQISEEMSCFANWPIDEKHSRRDVTNVICKYIKENNLKHPGNGKIIIPDEKLTKILRWDPKQEKLELKFLHSNNNSYIFTLISGPVIMPKKSFYTNSDLFDNDNNLGNVLVFSQEDDKCILKFKKNPELEEDKHYTLYASLIYPTIQIKIGIHFYKNPKVLVKKTKT